MLDRSRKLKLTHYQAANRTDHGAPICDQGDRKRRYGAHRLHSLASPEIIRANILVDGAYRGDVGASVATSVAFVATEDYDGEKRSAYP
jgi:hypothetical protein